ncbi:MAG: Aspartyl/glutamyl-tRNA(Asn/Gln) amidotransferase subunit C [Candidatus Woesebacteria bacterium GW2011_GWB1_38_5]|uniref:Aspartyl/glutamyl-tRNA(Asn/Gln) amidotransferase subunit C n=4 Tax=Candidatus Woeseibacteriota TaxID=1752722 RepID=A0A0G0NE89_9BACT|nr:MAG: Aspartyl/glutamyl-tRNA(Asn/Gln) amidotransferase subunit C [Candidatus Woesebacteria bacterium GW2011_GWD1_38_10]KKQ56672.1 MAG: Aspartyl/glutamyl-tRNA(Asn/Gln) amidotransferase subunit C [Candidatus Woesebacteria bacterium GW2011_GWC1_38_13]KKQ75431.1 MAG: Aspartyl/glutamyl-tRNA(Asn/Gln) amidotransferase subunit C [Candidatus Woesebacteria bacterium GW2011_GWB1_38_5]KKQ84811.1 MAG: Aspartyl/glutamyl-tRNA(Asn/Gln) amidotransferase subunit C [Candidatus Woesebacteria bacterium GW2011_GWA1
MIKIKHSEIVHLADLAQIKINKKEIQKLSLQLSKIVDYVSELNDVDTKNAVPTNQTTGLTNVTNDDLTSISLKQEDAVGQSKNIYQGFFKVPITIKNKII